MRIAKPGRAGLGHRHLPRSHRHPTAFTDAAYLIPLYDSLHFYLCRDHTRLLGYVFMPDHIHLLLWSHDPHDLGALLRDFKSFTAKRIMVRPCVPGVAHWTLARRGDGVVQCATPGARCWAKRGQGNARLSAQGSSTLRPQCCAHRGPGCDRLFDNARPAPYNPLPVSGHRMSSNHRVNSYSCQQKASGMKPAPFAYFAPTSLDEALALLAEHGDAGKVLAGGQSLVPAMNFRLAQPTALVDLNNVAELFYLEPSAQGGIRIGAMTRQRTVERSPLVARCAPLLHATMPNIAHVQIRNRGTIGGSLAHADPAAELPAVMVALDATFTLQRATGRRTLRAADFYQGLFTTALEPDELLVEIELPAPRPRTGWAMLEMARRRGDYAIVGLAATVELDAAGRCTEARLIYLSVGEGPTPAPTATALLAGQVPTPEAIAAAAHAAATADIEPLADIHASAAYRRHLVEVLARRALTEAVARA